MLAKLQVRILILMILCEQALAAGPQRALEVPRVTGGQYGSPPDVPSFDSGGDTWKIGLLGLMVFLVLSVGGNLLFEVVKLPKWRIFDFIGGAFIGTVLMAILLAIVDGIFGLRRGAGPETHDTIFLVLGAIGMGIFAVNNRR